MTAPGLEPGDGAEPEVARALARAAIYRLLGTAFAYPTAGRVGEVAAIAAAAAPAAAPAVGAALAAIAAAVRDRDASPAPDEYVFLFDREARCPPYEGAYGPAQLAGKAAQLADVAGFYAAFGLAPSPTAPDLEDHVAAELEFMSALALKEAWAVCEGDAEGLEVIRGAQLAFLTDHLGRWAESFAEDVRAATPLTYYASAAALLGAWMRAEITALGATPTRLGARAADPGDAESFACPMADDPGDPDPPSPETSS